MHSDLESVYTLVYLQGIQGMHLARSSAWCSQGYKRFLPVGSLSTLRNSIILQMIVLKTSSWAKNLFSFALQVISATEIGLENSYGRISISGVALISGIIWVIGTLQVPVDLPGTTVLRNNGTIFWSPEVTLEAIQLYSFFKIPCSETTHFMCPHIASAAMHETPKTVLCCIWCHFIATCLIVGFKSNSTIHEVLCSKSSLHLLQTVAAIRWLSSRAALRSPVCPIFSWLQ